MNSIPLALHPCNQKRKRKKQKNKKKGSCRIKVGLGLLRLVKLLGLDKSWVGGERTV